MPDPNAQPEMIEVQDSFGRTFHMTRESWRNGVMLGSLEAAKGDFEKLFAMISKAFRDGFEADLLEPAENLLMAARTDAERSQAAALRAALLEKLGRNDEALPQLLNDIELYGSCPYAYYMLGLLYQKGHKELAKAAFRKAIEGDPNYRSAFVRLAKLESERDGTTGEIKFYRQAAQSLNSSAAYEMLGLEMLKLDRKQEAIEAFGQAIAVVPRLHEESLRNIVASLSHAGLKREAIDLVAPSYDPKADGMWPGLNLVKTCIEAERFKEGRALLEKLFAQRLPQWHGELERFDVELSKFELRGLQPVGGTEYLQAFMTPIWLRKGTPGEALPRGFGAKSSLAVLFCTVRINPQLSQETLEWAGRFGRGIQLYLAERVPFCLACRSVSIVTFCGNGAFLVSEPYESLGYPVKFAKKYEYALALSLRPREDDWVVEFGLYETEGEKELAVWSVPIRFGEAEARIREMSDALVAQLAYHVPAQGSGGSFYDGLGEGALSYYVAALEKAIAVKSGRHRKDGGALQSERSILNQLLTLSGDNPTCPAARMLLMSCFEDESMLRPDIADEFFSRIQKLDAEHPIGGVYAEPVKLLLDSVAQQIAIPPNLSS